MKKILDFLNKATPIILGGISLDAYRRTLNNDESKKILFKAKQIMEENQRQSLDIIKQVQELETNKIKQNINLENIHNKLTTNDENIKFLNDNLQMDWKKLMNNGENLSNEAKSMILENMNNTTESLMKESQKKNELLNTVTNIFKNDGGSNDSTYYFINNIWDQLSNIIEKSNDFVSNASITELGAIGHISMSLAILLCLISIVAAFSGNAIIQRFNLEEKYPKIAKYIRIRQQFQMYYFFINILTIVFIIIFVIYINICVLFKF